VTNPTQATITFLLGHIQCSISFPSLVPRRSKISSPISTGSLTESTCRLVYYIHSSVQHWVRRSLEWLQTPLNPGKHQH